MRYHLFQKFFGKMVKIKETSFLLIKCLVSIAHHCRWVDFECPSRGVYTILKTIQFAKDGLRMYQF